MGDVRGFLKHGRESTPYRKVEERLDDWRHVAAFLEQPGAERILHRNSEHDHYQTGEQPYRDCQNRQLRKRINVCELALKKLGIDELGEFQEFVPSQLSIMCTISRLLPARMSA